MATKTWIPVFIIITAGCTEPGKGNSIAARIDSTGPVINNVPLAISGIPLPGGFIRIAADSNSFGFWLRRVGLKNDKTVHLYDGSLKRNQLAQYAVLDVTVGDKNLQQCADAVMRLRAEYLFAQKRYRDILFTDNAKNDYRFSEPYTLSHLHEYLEKVFAMCGTASLAKQLNAVADLSQITIGDVLIRGGSPGHAVIVMDVAADTSGNKIYLLAQSYMPAQDIHVLVNPSSTFLSPWYRLSDKEQIFTPEYVFNSKEFMTW